MKCSDFYIAIYTNECKSYCDERFFRRLRELTIGMDCIIHIVDNSAGPEYFYRLEKLVQDLHFGCRVQLERIVVDRTDKQTLFLRNVAESLSVIRSAFLKTDKKYFVIFESDIYPYNDDVFDCFLEHIDKVDIIGGIYYHGFHTIDDFDTGNVDLHPINHVLSGCALYKRAVIEKFPFRWSRKNLGAFPDAWICDDCNHRSGGRFKLANFRKIKCDHMSKPGGSRGQENLR